MSSNLSLSEFVRRLYFNIPQQLVSYLPGSYLHISIFCGLLFGISHAHTRRGFPPDRIAGHLIVRTNMYIDMMYHVAMYAVPPGLMTNVALVAQSGSLLSQRFSHKKAHPLPECRLTM